MVNVLGIIYIGVGYRQKPRLSLACLLGAGLRLEIGLIVFVAVSPKEPTFRVEHYLVLHFCVSPYLQILDLPEKLVWDTPTYFTLSSIKKKKIVVKASPGACTKKLIMAIFYGYS